jgi:hypothetical protein
MNIWQKKNTQCTLKFNEKYKKVKILKIGTFCPFQWTLCQKPLKIVKLETIHWHMTVSSQQKPFKEKKSHQNWMKNKNSKNLQTY